MPNLSDYYPEVLPTHTRWWRIVRVLKLPGRTVELLCRRLTVRTNKKTGKKYTVPVLQTFYDTERK